MAVVVQRLGCHQVPCALLLCVRLIPLVQVVDLHVVETAAVIVKGRQDAGYLKAKKVCGWHQSQS